MSIAQCGCAVSVVGYKKVVANRPSLLTMYKPQPLYKALELQVGMKFVWSIKCLIITQVSSVLKKSKFSKCKYLHAKIASLAL